jgi:hypothetical protein
MPLKCRFGCGSHPFADFSSPTIAPAKLVQEIKTGSSKWLKTKGVRYSKFSWQTGYAIFSVSPSHRPALETYIANQTEHHRKVSFQDEYRRLLKKIRRSI